MPAFIEERSALEQKLIDAAFQGDWVGFSESPDPSREQPDITVQGSFIRKLLLGLISTSAVAPQNPRMYGVRLRGAIIKGEIDLSDCSGSGGAPLAPLLLEHCIIKDGKPISCNIRHEEIKETRTTRKICRVINATNARLSRLSLEECHIDGRIDLTNAKLDGALEISGIKPFNDCCHIYARGCRIDRSLIAKRAELKIPAGLRTEFDTPDYALNLLNTEIGGSIILQPDFTADGGIDVRGAHVSHDIWAEAATFIASVENAFRAESLHCDGVVALRGEEKTKKSCRLDGNLNLLSASVGYLDLRGISIRQSPHMKWPQDYAIRLDLAHVLDNLRLNPRRESSSCLDTCINAPIKAPNLRVGGDLILDRLTASIDLTSVHVEGNLSMKDATFKSTDTNETNQAGGEKALRCGLFARNITIGNDCDMTGVSGAADLELSRIGGSLKVVNAKDLHALNASDTEVRGSVIISGRFQPQTSEQSMCFDGGSFLSGFYIGDDRSTDGSQDRLIIKPPTTGKADHHILSIENAFIENDFQVARVELCSSINVTAAIPIIISLRGLKARVFRHSPSESWGSNIKLKLDGFEYERIDTRGESREQPSHAPTKKAWFKELRKFWLLPECVKASADAHEGWLSLQVGQGAEGYDPQPYEQLARALYNDGKYEVAKHITRKKLSLEQDFIYSGWTRPFWRLLGKFDYGLFPGKSVIWFLGLLIFGWVAFAAARDPIHLPCFPETWPKEPMLVRNLTATDSIYVLPNQPCLEVDSFWYALDVFVPLLDLRQEDKCTISMSGDAAFWWRLFKALYAIFGAFVTSIMILSLTGLLRRYIER